MEGKYKYKLKLFIEIFKIKNKKMEITNRSINSLDTPLILKSPEEAINTYLFAQINQEEPSEEQKTQAVFRKCLIGLLGILSGLRAASFANASLKVPFIGPACLTGNLVASTVSDTYFGSCIIEDLGRYRTVEEKILSPKEQLRFHQIARIFAEVISSLASQVPTILTAVLYSPPELGVPTAIINGVVGSMTPLYSMWLLEKEKLYQQLAADSHIDPSVLEQQKQWIEEIEKNMALFISSSPEEKQTLINNLALIRVSDDSTNKIQLYLEKILSITVQPSSEPTISENVLITKKDVENILKIKSFLLTLIYLYAKGEFTFVTSKELVWDNNWLAGTFTALYEVTSAYGTKRNIENATSNLFHSIADRNAPLSEKSLVEQLRGKQISQLKMASCLINVLSLGVTYIIWKEFYSNELEKNFFIASMSIAVFLIFSSAMLKVIDGSMLHLIASQGTPEEKAILRLVHEMQQIKNLIKNTSPEHLEKIFAILPKKPSPTEEL